MERTKKDFTIDEEMAKKLDINFEVRLRNAKVMVIGAGYLHTDITRWSKIDPNYIGVSFMADYRDNPIPHLGDWNREGYWDELFGRYGKKFDAIYIDGGTIRHMINSQDIANTSFGRFIRYIYDYNITNYLFVEQNTFDATTIDKKWEKIMSNKLFLSKYMQDRHPLYYRLNEKEKMERINEEYQNDRARFKLKSRYRNQFFDCCGPPQEVEMPDESIGIWTSYKRNTIARD